MLSADCPKCGGLEALRPAYHEVTRERLSREECSQCDFEVERDQGVPVGDGVVYVLYEGLPSDGNHIGVYGSVVAASHFVNRREAQFAYQEEQGVPPPVEWRRATDRRGRHPEPYLEGGDQDGGETYSLYTLHPLPMISQPETP